MPPTTQRSERHTAVIVAVAVAVAVAVTAVTVVAAAVAVAATAAATTTLVVFLPPNTKHFAGKIYTVQYPTFDPPCLG